MIFIGTAGWGLRRDLARKFPGNGSHLQRYAGRLNCAEINSSFYRAHSRATYERWADAVPSNFRFAVKVPRAITHHAELRRARVPLRQFLREIGGLGERLGPLLIQLPPSLVFEARVAQVFFSLLRDMHRGSVVIEPRHASWFTNSVDRVLQKYSIGRVAADPSPAMQPLRPGGAIGKVRYYRLHGSPRMYWSDYSRAYLRELANAIQESKTATWIVFDNTAGGRAIENALQLQALVTQEANRPGSRRRAANR